MKLFSDNLPPVKNDEGIALLKNQFPQYDLGYICQATAVSRSDVKNWIEDLWQQYEPYADKQFPEDFKRRFMQRSWELYLGTTLLNRGFKLGAHKDFGPDFDAHLQNGERLAWIEAVATEKGDGPDKVPEIVHGVVMAVPEKEMLLRIANALDKKFKQYQARLENKIVQNSDPYVIAINRSDLEHPESNIPLIIKVLFPIGHLALRIMVDGKRAEKPESFWTTKLKIDKHSGKEVPTLFFEEKEHEGISAVIYCIDSILNSPQNSKEMGENFVTVHNPLAKNPLPNGIFPFGDEYKAKGGFINKIRHRNNTVN